jgi:hypothetical protein
VMSLSDAWLLDEESSVPAQATALAL